MCEPIEHGKNGHNQIIAFVPPLPVAPVSWRPEGDVMIWVDIPGHLERCFGMSPEFRQLAVDDGKLLMVEVGPGGIEREQWVPMEAA